MLWLTAEDRALKREDTNEIRQHSVSKLTVNSERTSPGGNAFAKNVGELSQRQKEAYLDPSQRSMRKPFCESS